MPNRYYGPTALAELEVSKLLKLDYSGREQDWELEFANPLLVEQILGLVESESLDFEVLCAISLLLIASIQECDSDKTSNEIFRRIENFMFQNNGVKERMLFYWIDLGRADDVDLVRKLLKEG